MVISVDYRLAPEHKFPAGLNDCFHVTKWAIDHASELSIDPTRVFVSGESAGGNFAAVVALKARDEGGPDLEGQILLYPGLTARLDKAAYDNCLDQHFAAYEFVRLVVEQYLRTPEDADNPYVSPLLAKDLSGLPPAIVVLAEHDPLTVEGRQYAARLRKAEVPVNEVFGEGAIHCFLNLPFEVPQAEPALRELTQYIQAILEAH